MTKNQGYSEALAWAVSHFQDDDFDSPLYFLQNESAPRRIEKSMVENIKKLLVAMRASFRRPSTNHRPFFTDAKGDFNCDSFDNSSSQNDVETAAQTTSTTFSSSKTKGGSTGNSNGISSARDRAPPPPPSTVLTSPKIANTGGVEDSAILRKEEAKQLRSSPTLEETVSSVEGSIGSRSSIKKQVSRGGTTLGTQKLSLDERKKL